MTLTTGSAHDRAFALAMVRIVMIVLLNGACVRDAVGTFLPDNCLRTHWARYWRELLP